MKSFLTTCLFLLFLGVTNAFAPAKSRGFKVSKLGLVAPGPVVNVEAIQDVGASQFNIQQQSIVSKGVSNWLEESNTMSVSLQERKPPTKEEIEQKKKTFNLW
eukprot:CAMPEP_0196810698 /NCGR_PEP_ID=MMETSP1362-20130617/13244_1 /TAXON_ID=163516 /ORGANISM="Leptocylindrus danicus, Strain CCMP1856" /LENGTH=102 /DNA_ID=CAMNT_0042185807 /DNA_START=28 /DNA_END=333 /DNA_ORIENTATION=-